MKKLRDWNMIKRPTIIDGEGEYITRSGERVKVSHMNTRGTPYAAHGYYLSSGIKESWDVCGRIFPNVESANDIVSKA